MGVLSDWQIARDVKIDDAQEGIKREGKISYGYTSYGYDCRIGYVFDVFSPIHATEIDPKNFDKRALQRIDLTPGKHTCIRDDGKDCGDFCYECAAPKPNFIRVPPHSFVLGESVETFHIPRDVLCIVLGKSTYARCFTGETKVTLIDGTTPSLKELTDRWDNGEREFFGIGYRNSIGGYVSQPLIHPRLIGQDRILEVMLDNGEKIRCTPDHNFYMRDGGVKQANELTAGDSLLPVYINNKDGYDRLWNPFNRKYDPISNMTDNMLVRQGKLTQKLDSIDIHHKDKNTRNNYPDNLERMTKSEHAKLHNEDKDLSAQSKLYWADEDNKRLHLTLLHTADNVQKAAASRSEFYKTDKGKLVAKNARKKMWDKRGQDGRDNQAEVMRSINLRRDVTEQSVRNALVKTGSIRGAARELKVDRSAFRRFPVLMKEFKSGILQNNHKVVSVRDTGMVEDVYCLTAPDTHNFALASGVIVSNCGLIVNVTPGEPEWVGKWTIEISNTTDLPARIYAGEGIMQCVFLRTDGYTEANSKLLTEIVSKQVLDRPDLDIQYAKLLFKGHCEKSYADKKGKYQNQTGLTMPTVDKHSEHSEGK